MQELNARVDIDKEKPADVAHDYLKSAPSSSVQLRPGQPARVRVAWR